MRASRCLPLLLALGLALAHGCAAIKLDAVRVTVVDADGGEVASASPRPGAKPEAKLSLDHTQQLKVRPIVAAPSASARRMRGDGFDAMLPIHVPAVGRLDCS